MTQDPVQAELYRAMKKAIETISKRYDPRMEFRGEFLKKKHWLDNLKILEKKDIELWERGWLKLIREVEEYEFSGGQEKMKEVLDRFGATSLIDAVQKKRAEKNK